jgi:prepilin-type N-terminal cleavage/methylation domain-containing protein/prepilin-type processing-associated H-X9-DG protein
MTYIHKLGSVLSSNFLICGSFSLSLRSDDQYHVSRTNLINAMSSHFARAFTLIELLVVVAVIAILVALAVPVYTGILERAKATKDMSNLRQIGMATQAYMNDSDGVLPPNDPVNGTWAAQLELNKKYLSVWRILQSPFDKRASSEAGTNAPVSPISYGINVRIYPNNAPISATKITNPTGLILFAPAQDNTATVNFQGFATSAAPGVNLLGNNNAVTSTPGGVATGGTHNSRRLINALFADLHCETMSWTTFTNTTSNVAGQPDQWTPYTPYP